jgi:hypothetical protein
MLLCFDSLAFGDVVCDVGGADDLAFAIVNRRNGDRAGRIVPSFLLLAVS